MRTLLRQHLDSVVIGRLLVSALVSLVPLRIRAEDASAAHLITDEAYTHSQRLVDIGAGRRLNLYCLGTGSPTVVFDAGVTGDTSAWGLVQPEVAQSTRACSYDRAGVGFSDPPRRTATSSNIVDDLHRLLVAANVKPPYVLVGHSYGGLNVRLFASRFPREVLGMVLVDPEPEDWIDAIRKLLPQWETDDFLPKIKHQRACLVQAHRGFIEGSDLFKTCVLSESDPEFSDAINAAHLKLAKRPGFQRALLSEDQSVYGGISEDQVRSEPRGLGDMPLVVLTRSPNRFPLAPTETAASREAIDRAWLKMQDDTARLSSNGTNQVVPDAGHDIHLEQPQAVIDAIEKVTKATRDRQ